MNTLADNVELDGSFTPEDVRNMLVDAVNLAWSQNGNNARCTVTANFIAWILLENDRLHARVAELEAHNKRMWDFICSLDGMNAGHMHDGAIDDEIAIVASDFDALAAAEHSQKPEPDRQD